MQFGFKSGLSSTQCTYVLEELIQRYNNGGSNVYVMLLDASKAFDLVEYVKLFTILKEREICPTVTKLLLTLHLEHLVSVKWLDHLSEPFHVSNGVKQGSIMSPVLFTVYVDILLRRLQESGLGCRIGHIYAGSESYADDITLISPSKRALEKMLDICTDFATEYKVTFNPDKSQLLYYPADKSDKDIIQVNFNGTKVSSCNDAIHLGHYISPDHRKHECTVKRTLGDF